jgi:hypothetical protein
MAYQALATGPISFLDANSNQQEIPLSAISFGPNGPDASSWPNYPANSGLIKQLLQQLVSQGLLTPSIPPPGSLALSITAAKPGAAGNVTQVTISNVSTTANTMTVAVSATEVYPGLTTATLGAALGTTVATANGIVYLQTNNNQPPAAFTGNIGGADLNCAVPEAADASKTAFILAATDAADAADAANISVTVAPDPSPATTFSLTATWNKSQNDVTLAMLTAAATNPFGLLVTFTAPPGGPLPGPGTVTLRGGANASSSSAATASATILSS